MLTEHVDESVGHFREGPKRHYRAVYIYPVLPARVKNPFYDKLPFSLLDAKAFKLLPMPGFPGTSKSASTDVCFPADLTCSAANLSPRIMFIASTIRDFPVPVSPVIMLRLSPKLMEISSIIAKFLSLSSTAYVFWPPEGPLRNRGAPRKFSRATPGFRFLPDRPLSPRISKS